VQEASSGQKERVNASKAELTKALYKAKVREQRIDVFEYQRYI
jgi:hypothetical protein